MRLKELFIVTAAGEIVTGVALMGVPSVVLAALLGIQPATAETLVVGRVAGAALIAIGVVCALACGDTGSPAQRGVLAGVLVYDVLVAFVLAYAGFGLQMVGPALWTAVALHALLAIWCIICLRSYQVDHLSIPVPR